MAVQIKCCKYDDDPRIIDKKPKLIKSIEARITEPFNARDPEIFVSNTDGVEHCNYFVIHYRKYFKSSISKVNNKMLRIKLHEDVLSTWLPKLYVLGSIKLASHIVSDNIDQKYICDEQEVISRVKLTGSIIDPLDLTTDTPIYVVQCPLPSIKVDNPITEINPQSAIISAL